MVKKSIYHVLLNGWQRRKNKIFPQKKYRKHKPEMNQIGFLEDICGDKVEGVEK